MATASFRTLSPNSKVYRSVSTFSSWNIANTVTVKIKAEVLSIFYIFYYTFNSKEHSSVETDVSWITTNRFYTMIGLVLMYSHPCTNT